MLRKALVLALLLIPLLGAATPISAGRETVVSGEAPAAGSGTIEDPGFVRVVDGDTVEVYVEGRRIGVAVAGIEAPPGNTPCGREAAAALRALVRGGVRLEEDPQVASDDRDRRVYQVRTRDGVSVGERLVESGLARTSRQGGGGPGLATAERAAREKRAGCAYREDREDDTPPRTREGEGRTPPRAGEAEKAAAPGAASTSLPSGFVTDVLAFGFVFPTEFAFLPDGRILVAEKGGVVWVIKNGVPLATPLLDIRERVNDYWDRGLVGLTVDPQFATNGYIYLLYAQETDPNRYTGTKTARVSRFKVTGDVASPSSETVILGKQGGTACKQPTADCIPAEHYGHIGGSLRFAPDSSLFVSLGDAANWNLVSEDALRAQNLDSPAGKVLRVTRDGAGVRDNPFWNGNANANRSKVWAYGLRNPFRFGLRPGSGLPYLGDVGWSTTEEIDVATRGANFGWPCYEGTARQSGYESKAACRSLYSRGPGAVRPPAIAYRHNRRSAAVVGGTFYTGSAYPEPYRRAYFYGDYVHGYILAQRMNEAHAPDGEPLTFATAADAPVAIQMGPDDGLYYLAIATGELRRVRYASDEPGPRFGPPTSLPAGDSPHGVVAADLDRDGRPDLVAVNADSDGVSVLLGNGGGTFRPRANFPTGVHPKEAETADFDGDGHLDLVVANQDASNVAVLLGSGDGRFGGPTHYPVCSRPHGVAVGDFNRDARPDVALACWDGTVISVLLGTGGGRLGNAVSYGTGNRPHSIAVGDFDRDGKPDLAVANHGSDNLSVLLGNGDGTFRTLVNYAAGRQPHSVRVADLDGDGRLDLASANDRSDDVSVLLGNGDGTFRPARSYSAGRVPKAVAIGDVDGDGHLDLVTANTAGNGDGVTSNVGGDNISVLLGDGQGGFAAGLLYQVGKTPFALVVADLNGDGGRDIATANWDSDDVTVLLNRSGSSGGTPPTASIGRPKDGLTYKVGDTIEYAGSATDAGGQPIPPGGLRWQVILHHCQGGTCHTHPLQGGSGASGSFTVPDHGDEGHVELRLTATDGAGRRATDSLALRPRTATLTLTTSPPGLEVIYLGEQATAPLARTLPVGSRRTIAVPSPQGGRSFQAWSDGGQRQHDVTLGEGDATYTATFAAAGPSISRVRASGIMRNRATITWQTDRASDTQVEYGTTTAYGSSTALVRSPVTTHRQNLTGLRPNTVYHFRVKSRTPDGLTISENFTFTTAK